MTSIATLTGFIHALVTVFIGEHSGNIIGSLIKGISGFLNRHEGHPEQGEP